MSVISTDIGLAEFATWAPLAMAVLLVLAFCWRDRGRPATSDEPDDPWSPATAPGRAWLEQSFREAEGRPDADHG